MLALTVNRTSPQTPEFPVLAKPATDRLLEVEDC